MSHLVRTYTEAREAEPVASKATMSRVNDPTTDRFINLAYPRGAVYALFRLTTPNAHPAYLWVHEGSDLRGMRAYEIGTLHSFAAGHLTDRDEISWHDMAEHFERRAFETGKRRTNPDVEAEQLDLEARIRRDTDRLAEVCQLIEDQKSGKWHDAQRRAAKAAQEAKERAAKAEQDRVATNLRKIQAKKAWKQAEEAAIDQLAGMGRIDEVGMAKRVAAHRQKLGLPPLP